MPEKRHTKRWQLFYNLRVFDVATEDLLGHAVDITTEGLMLISEKAILKGVIFNLTLEVPDARGSVAELQLKAQSRWSVCDVKQQFFDTGFRLVNPSVEAVETIQRMIEELHVADPAGLTVEQSRYNMARAKAS